jgi:hypothetical protein
MFNVSEKDSVISDISTKPSGTKKTGKDERIILNQLHTVGMYCITSPLYIEKENKLVLIPFFKPVIDKNRLTET